MAAVDTTDTVVVSAGDGEAVTPSDSAELTHVTRAIYVGTQGDLKVRMRSGANLTFVAVSGWLPLRVRQVFATGTDADDIVAVW